MAEVKLSESEIWRVVEAGLYILGYTDTPELPPGALTMKMSSDNRGANHITIKDKEHVVIQPVKYKEKTGKELISDYKQGQWKEEDTEYAS